MFSKPFYSLNSKRYYPTWSSENYIILSFTLRSSILLGIAFYTIEAGVQFYFFTLNFLVLFIEIALLFSLVYSTVSIRCRFVNRFVAEFCFVPLVYLSLNQEHLCGEKKDWELEKKNFYNFYFTFILPSFSE